MGCKMLIVCVCAHMGCACPDTAKHRLSKFLKACMCTKHVHMWSLPPAQSGHTAIYHHFHCIQYYEESNHDLMLMAGVHRRTHTA